MKVKRDTPIPVPVTVEVLLADGQRITGTIPTGREDARIDLEIPGPPLAIRIDPNNLIPDINRSNNRDQLVRNCRSMARWARGTLAMSAKQFSRRSKSMPFR